MKGFDYIAEINLYRSKDGEIENLSEDEEDEEMFACEICDGLVKESDSKCPHCGALFEDDEDEEIETQPSRGPPRGPSRGGPPLQIALHLVGLIEVHLEVLLEVHLEVPLAAHHEVPPAVHHEVPPAVHHEEAHRKEAQEGHHLVVQSDQALHKVGQKADRQKVLEEVLLVE